MPDNSPLSGWDQYRLLVIDGLDRINREMKAINEKIDKNNGDHSREIAELQVQVGMLKVQAAMWAALAAAVVSVVIGVIGHKF